MRCQMAGLCGADDEFFFYLGREFLTRLYKSINCWRVYLFVYWVLGEM